MGTRARLSSPSIAARAVAAHRGPRGPQAAPKKGASEATTPLGGEPPARGFRIDFLAPLKGEPPGAAAPECSPASRTHKQLPRARTQSVPRQVIRAEGRRPEAFGDQYSTMAPPSHRRGAATPFGRAESARPGRVMEQKRRAAERAHARSGSSGPSHIYARSCRPSRHSSFPNSRRRAAAFVAGVKAYRPADARGPCFFKY